MNGFMSPGQGQTHFDTERMKLESITEPRFQKNSEPQVFRKTYTDPCKTAISINRSRGQICADRDRQLAIVVEQQEKLREFTQQSACIFVRKRS